MTNKAERDKMSLEARGRLAVRAMRDYHRLIGPLREAARTHGYALASHGSLTRDIDLIAVPWASEAAAAHVVAEAIRARAEAITGFATLLECESGDYFLAGAPGWKPHGRLGWCFHIGGGPYLDLAVMPRTGEFDMRGYLAAGGNAAAPKIPPQRWAKR